VLPTQASGLRQRTSMATKTITARRLITDSGLIEFPVLTISSDGRILEIDSDPRALSKAEDTLAAAFLDVHTHGAMGHDVMTASPEGLSELQQFLAKHGVAHYLPTTVTASIDDTLLALEALADAIESETCDGEAKPIGIHLEGPFLSHLKRGVHPTEKLQPPSIELFEHFQSAARGNIVLMTIAPELPEATELIRYAAANGVKLSLGHSNATSEEALAGIAVGATSATHTFNAMRALDHREPGIAGAVLIDDRIFAELICDGIHVAPAMVDLWFKAKGSELAILVTDAMSAAGMPDGSYELAGLPVTVANGRAVLSDKNETLAGSVLTMDRAVANLQRFTNASLTTAVHLASRNPAVMLDRKELIQIAIGALANLNRFNHSGRLIETLLRGHEVR
jgi:N-acetylglucosamine-6-phosphate deacetylase